MMIKFAWSRDRLPLTAADFSSKFKITRLHTSNPNQSFPQAHTCFFTVRYIVHFILLYDPLVDLMIYPLIYPLT